MFGQVENKKDGKTILTQRIVAPDDYLEEGVLRCDQPTPVGRHVYIPGQATLRGSKYRPALLVGDSCYFLFFFYFSFSFSFSFAFSSPVVLLFLGLGYQVGDD